MHTAWETELADFLSHLSSVQAEVLDVLDQRRLLLKESSAEKSDELDAREQEVVNKLQACLQQRADLLGRAAEEGLPAGSIRALHAALPRANRKGLKASIREAEARSRMLRLHSITNWVVVQRTLLHLAQMLEIIATRGRRNATYGNAQDATGPDATANGALVDGVA